MADDAERMRSRFDAIVEGLELDLPDDLQQVDPPVEPRRPAPERRVPVELDEPEFDDLPDEPFYRQVDPVGIPQMAWPTAVAWVAALGVPALLVTCTLVGVFLDRGVVLGAGFIACAGATYLFSRLPSRGRPDSPGDGAVL